MLKITKYILALMLVALFSLYLLMQGKDGRVVDTGVVFVFDKQDELDRLAEKQRREGLNGDDLNRYDELIKNQMEELERQGRLLYENKKPSND
jgi:hypothetical protein